MKFLFRLVFLLYIPNLFGSAIENGNAQGVRVDVGGIHVAADHISVQNKVAHADGNVHCVGDNFYARCDAINYGIQSKEIFAQGIDINIDGTHIAAQNAHISDDEIAVDNADLSINLGMKSVVPHVKSKKIVYDRKKKTAALESPRFQLGSLPLLGLPRLYIGEWIRLMNFYFNVGHSNKRGYFFQSEIAYNIYSDLYLGTLFDFYTKRGILFGPLVKVNSDNECVNGKLVARSGFIADHGKRGLDLDNTAIKKKRWFIDLRENYHFGEHIDTLADIVWASDGSIEEDFRPGLCENYEIRDSFLEFDYRRKRYLVTAFTRAKMNRYQHFSEQLPSLRLDIFPQEISDAGVYSFGFLDFTRLKRRKLAEMMPIEMNRIDGYFGVNRPINLKNSRLVPLVGVRWTRYGSEYDRVLGEIGFDWSANFHGIYSPKNPNRKLVEWKHVVRPVIKYRYVSHLGKQKAHKQIETKKEDKFWPTLDLSEQRNVDDLSVRSTLRVGLENDFWGKNSKEKIRKLGFLDFYQDFHFKHSADLNQKRKKTLSDFYILSGFSPRRWIRFEAYSRHNWEHFSIDEINSRVKFISGDLWTAGLSTKFKKNKFQQVGLDFSLELNSVSSLGFEAKFDTKHGRFLSAEVFYDTRWSGIWDIHLFCKVKNHSKREGRVSPGFSITLVRW